jgi:hypothetical protein
MGDNLGEFLEDEWYLVRHSGETPEIALHSAIYYLTRAKNGPRAILNNEHLEMLQRAAIERFTEIVLRDLQHANCGKTTYRGIVRSIVNYRRFCTFCSRQDVDPCEVRRLAADALEKFLEIELSVSNNGEQISIINCTYNELLAFAAELGIELTDRFAGVAAFCRPVE